MRKIAIVGAGITGCVAGYELARRGFDVSIIEREDRVGGLARTFRYGGFLFDIGPHRFFTPKKELLDFILGVLGNDHIVAPRHSDVYLFGRYYPWPLRPSLFFTLPLASMLRFAWDLALMIARNKKDRAQVFEDYVMSNYGPSLYNIFFKDYTRKFLGLSPREVHADWAREGMKKTIIDESVASRNLIDILKLFFIFRPAAVEFIYPSGGIGIFCERLAEAAKGRGARIMLGSAVNGIRCSGSAIEELYAGGETLKPEEVIWTGSLPGLCRMLRMPCAGLGYLSLLLFNVEIRRPARNFQWCYYGSKDIVFSRVSIPASFHDDSVPPGKGSLCVEVTCRKEDPEWENPRLVWEKVERGLVRTGLITHPGEIENVHIERIPEAYPIYTKNYVDDVKKARELLGAFGNLTLAGRTGLFWYNNMDDCIENGLALAREIGRRETAYAD